MLIGFSQAQRFRLLFLAVLVTAGCGILVYRLWVVQVSQGDTYTRKLREQTTTQRRLSPARGPIVDINGTPLADNRASFDIDFYLDELVRNYSQLHHGRMPKIHLQYVRKGQILTKEEVDVVKIVREAVEPMAKSMGFEVKLNIDDVRRHFRTLPNIPYSYRADMDFATLALFSERNLGVAGINVDARPVRSYPYGAFASHILGYVGRPQSDEDVAEDGIKFESVGQGGLEMMLDSRLQGKPGGKIMRINYKGYIQGEEGYIEPTVGGSVQLTLDARIQYILEESMRPVGRGAAVVMTPQGDILAMVSVPNFDPNHFVPKISSTEWKNLNEDPTAPLINRAVSTYAPGSTFKVLTALAALKAKAITPQTHIFSPGAILIGNRWFKDWSKDGMGSVALQDAMRMSCNTFFYQVGIRTKIGPMDDLGTLVGFGQPSGLNLPGEKAGIMPGPDWLKKRFPRERWTDAYTANVSIGQGAVEVSPMQMSILMASVANGGTVYYPRLLKQVTDFEGNVMVTIPVRDRAQLGVSMSDLAAVRQALLAVVEGGTGRKAGIAGIKIAGKTGTAQFPTVINGRRMKDPRCWFYGFAPYENPRYIFCFLVEGGVGGGATAGPIANDVLTKIFAMERGEYTPTMNYLSPAQGHFHGVQEVAPDPNVPVDPNAANATTNAAAPEPDIVNESDDVPALRIPVRRF